jgi:RNA polymerase sigma factor (sigma-70 family)
MQNAEVKHLPFFAKSWYSRQTRTSNSSKKGGFWTLEEDCTLHLNQKPAADIEDEAWTARLTALYEAKLLIYFRWLQGRYGDPELAMDAIQSAFVRMLSLPKEKRANIRSLESWAFSVVQNKARMLLRSHMRRRENMMALLPQDDGTLPSLMMMPETGVEGDLERAALVRENYSKVMDVMRTLTPKQFETLYMRLIRGLSFRQIAEVTGEKYGTVRVRYTRALSELREHLIIMKIISRQE